MSPFLASVLYLLLWRVSALAGGLIVAYLGFLLFIKGLEAAPGSIEVGVGQNTVKLSNVTPGVFYALFGAAIIVALIWASPAEIVLPSNPTEDSGVIESDGGIRVRDAGEGAE